MKKVLLFGLIVGIVGVGGCVAIIALVAGGINEAIDQAATEPEIALESTTTIIEVRAPELLAAYRGNEIAADTKYKDQVVDITGEIKDFGVGIFEKKYITMSDGEPFSLSDIQCFFSTENAEQLVNLKKGQTVTVGGKMDGLELFNVIVRSCSVQSIQP